jgi:hypothetical protein
MAKVAALVAAHIERWNTPSVELGVFGTADPEMVAHYFDEFVHQALEASVRDGLFYLSSAGSVLGVELVDGRRVVVKAYQSQWGRPFLTAVARVQRHLAGAGFPCPRPLAGPSHAGPTDPGPALAAVEAYVPDPGMRVLSGDKAMGISARGLAEQIEQCRTLAEPDLQRHPLQRTADGLYPRPHNPLFDFSLRADEADWIDQLAAAAASARSRHQKSLTLTIAHTDWSARNIRIDDHQVLVAYDWDSLALVAEPVAAGQAAATWCSTGEADDPIAPDPDEVHAYLDAYQAATNRHLAAEERHTAMASALWVLAYTARCEHAVEAVTGQRPERARARLATDGWRYLAE